MDKTRLLIKNMPDNDLSHIKKYFKTNYDAISVTKQGRQRIVVTFPNEDISKKALHQLHQNEFKNRILSVEYVNKTKTHRENEIETKTPENNSFKISDFVKNLYATNARLGFDQPPLPCLKYCYPKINRSILDSISIALLTIPKFYIQVLHLMNRMNLDPPFLPLEKPFIPPGVPCDAETQTDFSETMLNKNSKLLASDESELESDIDDDNLIKSSRKRKKIIIDDDQIMKKKAKVLLKNSRNKMGCKSIVTTHIQHIQYNLNDVFEKSDALKRPKIELNVTNLKLPEKVITNLNNYQGENEHDLKSEEKEIRKSVKFVTDEELKNNRISEEQLKELPFFKNYKKGEKSYKLYIKNLNKDVLEEDLKMIFGRFASNENRVDEEIHIKLMQYGKMKGQAFVTFITLKDKTDFDMVEKALDETNGYILKNKPMVVCFGKP